MMQIEHDSGFPIFGDSVNDRPVEFIYPGELHNYIKLLKKRFPPADRAQKDVIFVGNTTASIVGTDLEILEFFGSFENCYFINEYNSTLYVPLPDGSVRQAEKTAIQDRDWPGRPNSFFLYELNHVRFPNITKLLTARELDRYLEDRSVTIVATYCSLLRSEQNHLFFLARYLESRIGFVSRDEPNLQTILHEAGVFPIE
jgi:hypothetical protein